MLSILTILLLAIGTLGTVSLTYKLVDFIYFFCFIPSGLHRYQRNARGTSSQSQETKAWALVTGSSDGIGLQITTELARKGFNVVLHGRNRIKLTQKMSELQSQFPTIAFRTAVAEASELSQEVFNSRISIIVDEMARLPGPLTILINNIGGFPGGTEWQSFTQQSASGVDATINMNVRFTTLLTGALLPLLKQHGAGLVMVLGSGAGDMGIPYLSIYGASKAFLRQWTMSLSAELQIDKADIEVLGINIGKVTATAGIKEGATIFVPSANKMARALLARVGCGQSFVYGYWAHAIQGGFLELLPRSVMLGEIEKMLVNIRKEAAAKELEGKSKAA